MTLMLMPLGRQRLEHLRRNARMAAHADADDPDLGHIVVGDQIFKDEIAAALASFIAFSARFT